MNTAQVLVELLKEYLRGLGGSNASRLLDIRAIRNNALSFLEKTEGIEITKGARVDFL